MIDAIEPLAALAGVRLAALVADDGVPVAVPGGAGGDHDPEAVSAHATAWLGDLVRAIAPLSWEAPERLVLRAARGTLVLRRTHRAWLLVLLSAGLRSDDVLLAMDGTAARIERHVRGEIAASRPAVEPPPPFPNSVARENAL